MKRKLHLALSVLLVFSVVLASCSNDESEPTTTTQMQTSTTEALPVETEPVETKPTEPDKVDEEEPSVQGEPEMLWQQGHENGLNSVATSPDGLYVAVGEYLTTYIYRAADGELADVRTYAHSVEDLEYFPDGDRLANGLAVNGVVITNLEDNSELELHRGNNNRLAISPDGATIATGNRQGTVWLWQTSDGTEIAALDGPADEVKWISALAFHPTGNLLASAQWTDDGIVHVWDITSQSIVQTIILDSLLGNVANPMAYSPDGKILAAIVRIEHIDNIAIFDADNGEQLATFEPTKNIKDIAFSPADGLLAVSSQYETSIWNINTRKIIHTLPQTFDDAVSDWNIAVSFTPDGGHIAVVRFDGTAEMWRLPGAEPLEVPPIDIRTPPPLPGDVLFDTGSADLKAEAFPELEKLASELFASIQSAKIKFIGHTDSRGSDGDNQQLSFNRADAIKSWFEEWSAQNGADNWSFEIDGQGSSSLKVPDVDSEGTFLEEAGALNRRVEIEIEE